MTGFDASEMDPPDKPRKGGKLPPIPGRDAPFSELRQWLSDAIGLPPAVRVESVIRYGRLEDDALSIHLSNEMEIRCDRQKRLQTPGNLQAFFLSESDGLCHPFYLSRAEVGDVYGALCRLGTTEAQASELEILAERLDQFLGLCDKVMASLLPPHRYHTITLVRARPLYDPKYNGIEPHHPGLVVDEEWGKRFIRHLEWVSYLRVVHGQTVDDKILPGRMREIGSERHELQAWPPGQRTGKVKLVFYEVPPA